MANGATIADELNVLIRSKDAKIGVIGLGYVGLPLSIAAAQKGFAVTGFDLDKRKLNALTSRQSYVEAISGASLDAAIASQAFKVTAEFDKLSEMNVIVICVPTPLSKHRVPDMSHVVSTLETISAHISPGTLVILESTTYPGTTDEVVVPTLTKGGLQLGIDVFVAFSPEREDPGNASFNTKTIPKLVAGTNAQTTEMAKAFYASFLEDVISVSSPAVAEATKITENVFRAVNIALVNELKVIFEQMNIDIWEVVDAAATKPFGFMPFYPGPGLGGHCIPVDPFYLSWKAREFGLTAQFIELAGEVNIKMPHYVIDNLRKVVDSECGLALSRSRILVVGAAYKKNVADTRESPAMEIMERLVDQGVQVSCLDPHVQQLSGFAPGCSLNGQQTIPQDTISAEDHDAILVLTDHDAVNWADLHGLGLPIVDTRNALTRAGYVDNVFKA